MTPLLWASGEPPALCSDLNHPARVQIIKEIKKGLPIELVGMVSEKDKIVCKSVVNLTFDLWEETVKMTGQSSKIPLNKLMPLFCQKITCAGNGDRFRILLNPLWEGRVAKMLGSNPQLREIRYYHFDPKTISKNLPSEIVILDQELRNDR